MASSRHLDPTTRRFALEAMIGLVVVLVLVALMVHGLVRRFGLMEEIAKPETVEMASILRRQPPRPPRVSEAGSGDSQGAQGAGSPVGSGPSPGSATSSDSPRSAVAATEPSTAGSAGSTLGGVKPEAAAGLRTPAIADHGLASGESSAAPVESSQGMSSLPTSLAGRSRGSPTPAPVPVPQPYRETEALPASRSLPSPFANFATTRNVDPRWKIRADDSSWSYCARVYDEPQRFRELETWLESRGKEFSSFRPGEVLEPPPLSTLEQMAGRGAAVGSGAGSESEGVYVTSGSESLFDVAARVLGQAGRYVELSELDREASAAPRDPLEPLPARTRIALPIRR